MRFTTPLLLIALLFCSQVSAADVAADASPATAADLEFFEKHVRPLFAEHCYACHSTTSEKLQAGLLVDSRSGLLRGGDSGPAMVPGDPDASLLIESVRYDGYEMPPSGKLADEEISHLERWVEMGAPWPKEDAPVAGETRPEFDLQQRKADHWVWQPVEDPALPTVNNSQWPQRPLDHFILANLETNQLQPAADADRAALLRRLYFDLIGLPPTAAQAASFLANDSPQAVAELVDELLASPHFGERWGRHWLDLVRYAESRGHEFDNDAPNAFQYRDYIIRAFNADVPHDQLVREHLAGDLLAEPRLHPEQGFNESVLGTGFWFLGEWVHSPVDIRKDEADRFDNMIDVMSKTFLGVTVSCARCHDHKFDAISTADYYSLLGFLQSSDYRQVRFESIAHNDQISEKLAELDNQYQSEILNQLAQQEINPPQPPPVPEALQSFIVVDYGQLSADQFFQDGFIFGEQPRRLGEPLLMLDGETPQLQFAKHGAAVNDPFWGKFESISEPGVRNSSRLASIPRSGRTLRTPSFELTSPNVSCLVRGQGHVVACVDSHRLIAGPLHGETVKKINPGGDWVELNLNRYLGHRLHLEFTPDVDAQLEVILVTQGASPAVRQQLLEHQQAGAKLIDDFAAEAGGVVEKSAALLQEWVSARSELQNQIQHRSQLAMAMLDGSGEEQHIYIRGNASKLGKIEPRHFLTAITGDQPLPISRGSGRLQLAEQINDPNNPLTARVAVNRIWHYLLGRGIVPTTDDFGVLGQSPTHPLLLDHLATQFMRDGRSLKSMIRNIVLSRTYQMSSQPHAEARQADPKNLLWHHRPPRRLEGEAIRDALLTISQQLDPTMHGQPVPIHLTAFMQGRGRPGANGPLDGNRRRSIYIAVRRNFLSPFMLTFDTPAPFSTMGRRNVSNVPAQALILMNDPLVVSQAKHWADRTLEQHDTIVGRIEAMYQAAFTRAPTAAEMSVAEQYIDATANRRSCPQDDPQVWADFAHALINTKEFIFLR